MDSSPSISSPVPRGTIVSITKYLPYDGIAHAGGAYVLQHYRTLGASFALTAIAPDTALNREALRRGVEVDTTVLSSRSLFAKDRLKRLADIASLLRGSTAHRWFTREAGRDPRVADALRAADIVELQWSEMAVLAPLVRALAPEARIVVIAHDVITQRWRRAAETSSGLVRRMAFRFAASLSARRESRSFAQADRVVVFSEKDADLVRALAPSAGVEVVHPGFPVPEHTREHSQPRNGIVFSGAMGRPDNDEAARWFLEKIWPDVRSAVPTAEFTIVGARPSPALLRLTDADPGVHVTGYVDSLDPYLDAAALVVVPLRNGAGVKFKTIEALLRGIPVVATTVGAEGIERPEMLAAITDDPAAFAAAVVDGLRVSDPSRTESARAWALSTYGLDAFRRRVADLYAALVTPPHR